MPVARVNEIELYYEVHGKGEPLLIIPGLSVDHHFVDPFLEDLKKHFEVIVIDLRGVGLSSAPDEDYTIKMMAQDVFELVDKHKWKKPHVLGSSMGGAIAQQLVYSYPDHFSKLVLSTTAMHFLAPTKMMLEVTEDLYAISASRELIVKHAMGLVHGDTFLSDKYKSKELFEKRIENPHFQSPIGYHGQLAALKKFDARSWVSKIKNPTLIIGADEDVLTPVEQSLDLHEAIENSHLMIVPDSGHAVTIDHTDIFVEHLIDYLSNETPHISSVAI